MRFVLYEDARGRYGEVVGTRKGGTGSTWREANKKRVKVSQPAVNQWHHRCGDEIYLP